MTTPLSKTDYELLREGAWLEPFFWRRSEQFCRSALMACCNYERWPRLHGDWNRYAWSEIRKRIAQFYSTQYGSLPAEFLAHRFNSDGKFFSSLTYRKWAGDA